MPLDDVWKTFHRTVGIHWKGNFDGVPPVAGCYAWFYPLRVTSLDLDEFLAEVRAVHLFDARTKGEPAAKSSGRIGWTIMDWEAALRNPAVSLPASLQYTWSSVVNDPAAFESMRRVLLRASLLMPPLYVGKAVDLRVRCDTHIKGRSDFAGRYEARALAKGFAASRVSDLVLVTMRTEVVPEAGGDPEVLVEEVLKLVGRPAYGVV